MAFENLPRDCSQRALWSVEFIASGLAMGGKVQTVSDLSVLRIVVSSV